MDAPLPPLPSIPPPTMAAAEPVGPPPAAPHSSMNASPPPAPQYLYPPPPPPRSNGCLWGTVILLILLLGCSMLFNLILAGGSTESIEDLQNGEGFGSGVRQKRKYSESLEQAGKAGSKDRIVRIDLEGVIGSGGKAEGFFGDGMPMVDKVKRSLEQAVNDPFVKAILLRVNSPGGEVTASDTMYAAVKEAAKKKPVVVFMDSIAASGGYYVSCGATKIVASETTLTASIGVIMQSMSYYGLFDKVGLGMNTFTSGPLKDSLSGARAMRPEEREYIQGLVNGMYDRFLTVVSEGRHLSKDELRKGVADGRVVSGGDALKAKLVDKIGYIEDAYNLARELGNAPNAMVVKYSRGFGFLEMFGGEMESRSKVELNLPGASMLPKLQPGQLYYLPESFSH